MHWFFVSSHRQESKRNPASHSPGAPGLFSKWTLSYRSFAGIAGCFLAAWVSFSGLQRFRLQLRRCGDIKLLKDQRGVIAIVYALSLLPLVVVIALAVDFGFYVLAQSQLNLAADAAAIHAVRVAQQTYIDYSSTTADAINAGETAGTQWFNAQLGSIGIAKVTPSVNVTYSDSPGGFFATVSYSGTVATNIGAFLLPSWPISNSVNTQTTNSYLEVILMLDNSSSMEIGASYSDIELMMRISPCMAANAWYTESSPSASSNGAQNAPYWGQNGAINALGGPYWSYICSVPGYTSYDDFSPSPALQCQLNTSTSLLNLSQLATSKPYLSSTTTPPYITSTLAVPPSGQKLGSACTNTFSPVLVNGSYPIAGSSQQKSGTQATMGQPCAFACHSDDSGAAAGQGNDNYALARSTIGSNTPITLRFDVLKQATNNILSTMKTAAGVSGNLSVGIYSFNTDVTQVYPSSGEAGTNFTAAIAAVGSPPTTANGKDTGIQPDLTAPGSHHADTDFYTSMTNLAQKYLTSAGNGKSAASPLKVLILITDGYQDVFNTTTWTATPSPIDVTRCTNLKSMGYTIYVIYTPYYPLMHYYYFIDNAADFTSGDVSNNLQSCASESGDYFQANNTSDLTAALNTILTSAENNTAQVSK